MKTPWHLWLVGIVALIWNAGGAYDYIMTQTRNEAYLSMMTPEQLAYFDGFPTWAEAVWAIGVWGAVLGSILLLLRSRFALWAFTASFAGMIANLVYGLAGGNSAMTGSMGTIAVAFSVAIIVIALLEIWYSSKMKGAGVLS
jgi:hypothetical protein